MYLYLYILLHRRKLVKLYFLLLLSSMCSPVFTIAEGGREAAQGEGRKPFLAAFFPSSGDLVLKMCISQKRGSV